MAALAPSLDLAPASFKALVARLPPSQRAKVAWFLPELRATLVEPLRAIHDEEELKASIDDQLFRFARLNYRMTTALWSLLRESAMRDIITSSDDERVMKTHRAIETRLGGIDPYAADALRESYAWFSAIFPSLLQQMPLGDHDAAFNAALSLDTATIDAGLRQGITGEWRALLQLEAFSIAALEAIDDESRDLPRLITTWCELALDGVHEAVPALRRAGYVIQTPRIPDYSERDWRNRWASHVLDGMTTEQLTSFEQDIKRSSSTRAA